MRGRGWKVVNSKWQACALTVFVLLSKISACMSAPPLKETAPVQSPFSAWTVIYAFLIAFYAGIVLFMVAPQAAEEVKRLGQLRADDDLRFRQLKAVCTYFHAGSNYRESISKAQRDFAHVTWGVSLGKLSEVVQDFTAANGGKTPHAFSVAYFLDSLEKKTMGRGDGLSDHQYKQAKDIFHVRHSNWKALPNWSDWNAILVQVKFGPLNPDFQFSPEFLHTSALWHQGNEQWPSSDNKAPTRVKVRQTPKYESTITESDVLQPSPLIR